jgi:outer membrane protein OmpA-like peptidoglycan-associated protein
MVVAAQSGRQMMRCGRTLLALAGSAAIAVPAVASDKLPPRPKAAPATSPAATSDEPVLLTPDAPADQTPPPVQPAPALPPAPTAEMPGTKPVSLDSYPFVLFFEWDSAELNPGAAEVLDNVAERFRAARGQVAVAGYADRSGSGDYNRDLSQRRVAAVKAYLVGKAVPVAAIATEAYGEAKPLVDTADGAREPQNRRVEITVSPAQSADALR